MSREPGNDVVGEDLDEDELEESDALSDVVPRPPASEPQRPRARKPATPSIEPEALHLSEFGSCPMGVKHWGMRKRLASSGEWETLGYAAPGSNVKAREWPLAELSIETVESRWGTGLYETQWVLMLPRGGRRVMRGGREFEIVARITPPVVATPQAVAQGIFAGPMGDALQLMKLFEQMKLDGVESSVRMMQLQMQMGARNGGGFGQSDLELVLRNNRDAMLAMIAPMQAEIASLRRELDADDSDESPGLVGAAANAAAPLLKGKGGLAQFANFATSNPELVKAALPIVADVVSKLAALVTPPAPRPQARLQAAPVEHVDFGSSGGMNRRPAAEVAAEARAAREAHEAEITAAVRARAEAEAAAAPPPPPPAPELGTVAPAS